MRPRAGCAQRAANREFALAHRRLREQKVGDIGARDQQKKSNSTEKNQERRPGFVQ